MKLSICCITYNHEAFIAQAIESFVMQQTNFDIEVVIHDDASTDATATIVASYANKYPDKIRATFNAANKGMMANFIACLNNCKGEYIALCEGDDYWIDPNKLYRQVAFLEKNLEYQICWTNGTILHNRSVEETVTDFSQGEVLNDEILRNNSFLTSTTIIRNNYNSGLPLWFLKSPVGDYCLYLHLMVSMSQRAYLLAENTAVYRQHEQGVWSKGSDLYNHLRIWKMYWVLWLNAPTKKSKNIYFDKLAEYKSYCQQLINKSQYADTIRMLRKIAGNEPMVWMYWLQTLIKCTFSLSAEKIFAQIKRVILVVSRIIN